MPGEQPTQAGLTRHDGSSAIGRVHQDPQCGGFDAEEDNEKPRTHDHPESALKGVGRPCRRTTETTCSPAPPGGRPLQHSHPACSTGRTTTMTTSPPPADAPAARQRTVPLVLGSALVLLVGAL